MNLEKIYAVEDTFPHDFAKSEQRSYGLLFYSEENRDSFDSNHALVYRDKISDLRYVLSDIIAFYSSKGLKPLIYQSITDEGYFEENTQIFKNFGFTLRTETQKYMVLCAENRIIPNKDISVCKISNWDDEYGTEIFEKAGEPWEIDVAKRALKNCNTLFFVAFYLGQPVGMTHCHTSGEVCRVDYLLVSKEHRNRGVGRALISEFVSYCHENAITNCYLWPDGETAEKIYFEAGFRVAETKQAARAIYEMNSTV